MAALIWGGAAVLAVLIELFVLDLMFVLLGLAAGATAVVAGAGAPLPVQIAVFAVAAVAGLFGLRPLLRRHILQPRETPTNVDALPGRPAKTLTDVTIDGGRILLNGGEWSARLDRDDPVETVAAGTNVTVQRIDGATAIVAVRGIT